MPFSPTIASKFGDVKLIGDAKEKLLEGNFLPLPDALVEGPCSPAILQLHSTLKCLSKCHIVISLVLLVLAALADYVSYRVNTVRMHGLAECCAFYFILMGVIGIFGSASHRRGLIITFLLMGLHGVLIFAPVIIIASSFDIHFYKRECWGECDWHLLSASIPKNSRCQILCGDNLDDNQKSSMSRLGTDYRLDAGLITLAIIEFLLSLATTALCFKEVFGWGSQAANNASASNVELQPLNGQSSPEDKEKDKAIAVQKVQTPVEQRKNA